MRIVFIILILVCFIISSFIYSPEVIGEGYHPDRAGPIVAYEHELKYLPPYCRCVASVNMKRYKKEKAKWARIFKSKGERGRDWGHIHHYCYGLTFLSRVNRGLGKRSYLLGRAESEFGYMIKQASPKFILMPEIHLRMGITKLMMRKDAGALKHFYKAIKLKNDFVPAYIQIIYYYRNHNNAKEALKIARLALKHAPNSKVLRKQLAELK